MSRSAYVQGIGLLDNLLISWTMSKAALTYSVLMLEVHSMEI